MDDDSRWVGFSEEGKLDFARIEAQSALFSSSKGRLGAHSPNLNREYSFDYPKSEGPDCKNCSESCCSAPHVTTLRLRDLEILKLAGLDWAIAPATNEESQFPSLKQIDGRCVFLRTDKRCAVYAIRPLVCRAFPLQVSDDDTTRIRYSSACKSRQSTSQDDELEPLASFAIENFEQKETDKYVVQNTPDIIEKMGLLRFVRGFLATKSYGKNFDQVLSQKKEG
jgi:Fe-S-cluster containining protein